MNNLFLCENEAEKVVVRINPELSPFIDRDYEASIVQHLAHKDLGPVYYGR